MKSWNQRITLTLVMALLTVAATAAEAACRSRDLAGRWMVHSMTLSEFGGNVRRCAISINDQGSLRGSCTSRVPGFRQGSRLTSSLQIGTNCAVTGVGFEDGVRGIVQGQLSPSKDVLSGITFSNFAVTHFTAVKR